MGKRELISANETRLLSKISLGKKFFLAIIIVLLLLIISLCLLFGNQILTILSFTRAGTEPLYVMTYYGDYGFDEFIKTGRYPDGHPLNTSLRRPKDTPYACSVFAARNKHGNAIFGRNFDWQHGTAILLYTNPPHGYRSVSLLDPFYCGFSSPNNTPVSLIDRLKLLATPWMPMDGMNEYGLSIAMMTVPNNGSKPVPGKLNINEADVIRLVLDHARNINEAVQLIKKYNVQFIYTPVHFLISDATNHSVIIEFVNGQMEVIPNNEPWQVATNFQIYGVSDGTLLCNRYATAYQTLKKTNGLISDNDAMKLLKEVSQPHTMWSAVYNQVTGNIQVRMGFDPKRVSQVKRFKLKLKE